MEATIRTIEQFFAGNGQNIREYLLRQACEHCDHYATDICILIDEEGVLLREFFFSDDFKIRIGFRDYGVDWSTGELPRGDRYRKICILRRCGNVVSLEE